jgi:hypothetical protein
VYSGLRRFRYGDLKEAAGVCGGCWLWVLDATLVLAKPMAALASMTGIADTVFRMERCESCVRPTAFDELGA